MKLNLAEDAIGVMHLQSYLVEVHGYRGDPVPEFTRLGGARSSPEASELAGRDVGVRPNVAFRRHGQDDRCSR